MVELTPEQARVVGSLVEKELATPQQYPLTLNALVAACNQTSNRDPIVDYDERTVSDVLASLKDAGLVRFVHPMHGGRVTKYRQVLHEVLGLERPELAVLAVLLLRGPQTTGELRARTDRLAELDSTAEVDAVLDALARRDPPLVTRLPRQPGQKEARVAHLLSGEVDVEALAAAVATSPRNQDRLSALEDDVRALREEVESLRVAFDALRAQFE